MSPELSAQEIFKKGEQMLLEDKDSKEAIDLFRCAAEQGHGCATYRLMWCLRDGIGCDKNEKEAARIANQVLRAPTYETVCWLVALADQGYAPAQCSLGACHASGRGLVEDYVMAVYWYRKAADQGHTGAQFNLGFCYEYGKGVAKNEATAVEWYLKAANQGYSPAQYNIGVCYDYGGLGLTQDHEMAAEWYRKAAVARE